MKKNAGNTKEPQKTEKKYLIAVEETRSIVALVSSIIVFFCTLAAVFVMIEYRADKESALHFFTALSNLLSAIGAAFMIPYAVEGIRKKRFLPPRWIVLFQYSGATCVAITMVTSIVLILPTQGIEKMLGYNFWLHIVTPACTVVLFQCVETNITFTRRDMILAQIPYWTYMAVYFVMVILVGKEQGGWSDFYKTQAFWPFWISLILMLAMGFGISALMRLIHNRHAKHSWNRIAQMWSENMEPKQLLIEAFGLGRYIGQHCSEDEFSVPLDVFTMMSERYGVSLEKLTKAYVKGVSDSIEERRAEKKDKA